MAIIAITVCPTANVSLPKLLVVWIQLGRRGSSELDIHEVDAPKIFVCFISISCTKLSFPYHFSASLLFRYMKAG